MFGGRFSLKLWQKALARWKEEKRWDKHHSRVATSRGEKAEQPEALTPSNPGHQRSLQIVLSEADQLESPNLDISNTTSPYTTLMRIFTLVKFQLLWHITYFGQSLSQILSETCLQISSA